MVHASWRSTGREPLPICRHRAGIGGNDAKHAAERRSGTTFAFAKDTMTVAAHGWLQPRPVTRTANTRLCRWSIAAQLQAAIGATRWPLLYALLAAALLILVRVTVVFADPGFPPEPPSMAPATIPPPTVGADVGEEEDVPSWPERLLRALTEELLRTGGVNAAAERSCSHGGSIRPRCRASKERTVVTGELDSCRLRVKDGAILGTTGEVVLAIPAQDACNGNGASICGVVTIERVRAVGTVADPGGRVIGVVDFSSLPLPRTLVVPCVASTAARAQN